MAEEVELALAAAATREAFLIGIDLDGAYLELKEAWVEQIAEQIHVIPFRVLGRSGKYFEAMGQLKRALQRG